MEMILTAAPHSARSAGTFSLRYLTREGKARLPMRLAVSKRNLIPVISRNSLVWSRTLLGGSNGLTWCARRNRIFPKQHVQFFGCPTEPCQNLAGRGQRFRQQRLRRLRKTYQVGI